MEEDEQVPSPSSPAPPHPSSDNYSRNVHSSTSATSSQTQKLLFRIPTISVEESLSDPDMSTGGGAESLIQENVPTSGERVEAQKKMEEEDMESCCSLESIPSLDAESESVSLGIKGEDDEDDDEDSDDEAGRAASLSSNSNGSFPDRLGLGLGFRKNIVNRRRGEGQQRTKSLGQVQLPSSVRRKVNHRNGKVLRGAKSEEERCDEIQAEELEKRLKALAAAFSARTIRAKAKIQQPPTPSSGESEAEDVKVGEPTLLDRLRPLASPGPSEFGDSTRRKSVLSLKVEGTFLENLEYFWNFLSCNYILDPQSSTYVGWLLLVSLFFFYNAWVIPLRVVFPYQTEQNELVWFVFDSIADFIYFVDVFIFKPHVKFIQNGFWVKEPKQTVKSYLSSLQFKVDLIALFPADIFTYIFYKNMAWLRIPRIFKVDTFWELFRQLDSVLAHPHRARIFHTCLYMLYMIHMVACMYYALSTWEGIATTTWTFDGIGNAYVRCFYFATKTATSIGKNPKPENELEYVFMTFAWLSGVFVFAILIGQIRDIIATATKSQTEYRILTSATVSYLHRLGVPGKLQDRVKLWLSYTWEQQKTLDETRILNLLPKSMKAEIALNIHVETLGKVQLFQSCETAFLQDLVVKLRSIIILPGDWVCKKGEIGREMFIVKSGKIQVIGGPSGTQVLASLGEGSVFGEIALLGIGGMNKRTADVRAAGFVNLFVLNKSDLNDVIRDYPEAQEIMQKKAKKLMRENIKKSRSIPSSAGAGTSEDSSSPAAVVAGAEETVIIKNKVEPPQLIHAMMTLFPPSTKIGLYLRKGSKGGSLTELNNSCEDDDDDDENYDEDDYYDGVKRNDGTSKLDDVYTSLTSYPPSPFMPISPGHISQQLDISVMTGDSLEKVFSPSQESRPNSWELPDPISDIDGEGKEALEQKSDSISTKTDPPSPPLPFVRRHSNSKSGRQNLFTSLPLPPETVEMEYVVGSLMEGRNSCPQYFSPCAAADTETNRDEIPIELRPPLYIIESRGSGGGGGRLSKSPVSQRSRTSSSIKKLRRIVLQQDPEEEDSSSSSLEEDFDDDDENVSKFHEGDNDRDGKRDEENNGKKDYVSSSASAKAAAEAPTSSKTKNSAAASAVIAAAHFVSRMKNRRSPLQRQREVVVDVDVDIDRSSSLRRVANKSSSSSRKKQAKSTPTEVEMTTSPTPPLPPTPRSNLPSSTSSYSLLEIDSD